MTERMRRGRAAVDFEANEHDAAVARQQDVSDDVDQSRRN